MVLTAKGGTDGANIALFWPETLPDYQPIPVEAVERLNKDGTLIWFLCEGDGTYHVAVYVDEVLPAELKALCSNEELYPRVFAQGDAYFGGMEDMTRQAAVRANCEKMDIPPGEYAAATYAVRSAQHLYPPWMREHAGVTAYRVWQSAVWMTTAAVFAVLGAIVVALSARHYFWPWAAGVAITVIGMAYAMRKSPSYAAAARANVAFNKAFPNYVVRMERKTP